MQVTGEGSPLQEVVSQNTKRGRSLKLLCFPGPQSMGKVQDCGSPQQHPDLSGRLLHSSSSPSFSNPCPHLAPSVLETGRPPTICYSPDTSTSLSALLTSSVTVLHDGLSMCSRGSSYVLLWLSGLYQPVRKLALFSSFDRKFLLDRVVDYRIK